MKGVYGRGKLKEISDVFNNMGSIPSLQSCDQCFVTDPTPDKADLQPCTHIKLLTPEEVARDEL
ncbi:hypothetical protein ANCCAN_15184 [Ancylostoma caninum]|uniref:Uncharacterized protein n=1 Tax=Ancylostoma caninum TaxID=29170 RepID=A0A368G7A8_ANCCA|nr:hypothetical protein ANCCAN_17494 [Ancylostoma caninum]RCN38890.1 hypothetical protein ANCCAN_15184 [Ancylostoma caninum]